MFPNRFNKNPLPPNAVTTHRINEKIKSTKVVLIDSEGNNLGIVDSQTALIKATDAHLDLVEVNANTNPPVCKIMNYGKFVYELKKKEKSNKQGTIETKEIRFSIAIADNDLMTKVKQAKEFIQKGWKINLKVKFNGREKSHPELGKEVLLKFAQLVGDDISKTDKLSLDGKFMSMMMMPK